MEISNHTLIAELLREEKLSVRAANICSSHGINTIGDLLSTDNHKLASLRHCGKKSLLELLAIKERFGSCVPAALVTHRDNIFMVSVCDDIIETMQVNSSKLRPEVVECLKKCNWTEDGFVSTILNSPDKFINSLKRESPLLRRDVILFIVHSLRVVLDNIRADLLEHDIIELSCKRLEWYLDVHSNEYRFYMLEQATKNFLNNRLNEIYSKLSTRTRNIFKDIASFETLLPYIYGNKANESRNVRLCGRKSADEFDAFLRESRQLYEDFLNSYESLSESERRELSRKHRCAMAKNTYHFLTDDEVSAVIDHYEKTGRGPSPLFFVYRCIIRTDNNQTMSYRMYYGLDGNPPVDKLETIGDKLGLSRERVRQLLSKTVLFPPSVIEICSGLLAHFDSTVIPYDAPIWDELAKNEISADSLSVYQMMALMTAIDDSLIIVTVTADKHYLVRKEAFAGLRLLTVIREIEQHIDNRRVYPEDLDIEDYITNGYKDGSGQPDKESVCKLIMHYLLHSYECNRLDRHTLTFPPTTFNVMQAIEDIIAEKGSAISYDELYERYVQQYPGHLPKNRQALKSYIFRNKNIRSIGKSGRYVLAGWSEIHTGTISDLLADLLAESLLPMTLNELYERVIGTFPNTKPASCATLMFIDARRRFVQFEKGYYGLAGRKYPSRFVVHSPRSNSYNFDDRLKEVVEFVRREQRMPYSGGDSNERQLARWVRCVQTERIRTDEGQREAFESFMAANKDIPQNGDELRFMRNCRRVIEFIEKTGSIPGYNDGAGLYSWLRKENKRVGKRSENCERYFREVREAIRRHSLELYF